MPTLKRPQRRPGHRRPTSDQRFYGSAEWKKARQIKLRTNFVCEAHATINVYIDCTERSPIDHIVPIELYNGAKTDQRNLMTLCKNCHERKSALEGSLGVLVETTFNEIGESIPVEGGRESVIRIILKD